ncbi:MAG: L-malyl-CoA/beta-methylmalyl-CoA lyase [Rhodobacter sp.]|nr:L-malyl-CoA/beta-methylmalyl-CoA lyase [Rhodobacter sp.]MCY4168991.1 L-malyl-CoA/beta-methylmalyl-CoA lyase [Rhodobacter sp.]MCY4242928.1 L-malyl-CoA/beta-methylmalyl-CoA lyase [Rhodobacter sp.]
MSFVVQPTAPSRPNRCQLFGPGSRPRIFEKMAASAADVINLDLEDSVAPDDKPGARRNVIEAIGDIDWGQKCLSVRINGLDTPYWYRDVVDLLERASGRLDQIMVPKVGRAADVYAVDALVTAVEASVGRARRVSLEVIIESAAGIVHVEDIAASSDRLQAMSLGAADFAASMGMRTTGIGGTQENYYMVHEGKRHWPDPWHWAQTAIVAACRAHGVLPVDGPFGDFSDDEGFVAQARRSATLGMVGKWAIHPRQVSLANEVFTPSEEQVMEAREILDAMERAGQEGSGATVYRGRLVDLASIRQAEVIVRQAEMIARTQPS